jgi:hypothetical protein
MAPHGLKPPKNPLLLRAHPSFECIPGCHDYCGPATTSCEEMARRLVNSEAEHEAALAELSCPHSEDKAYQVYAE